MNKYVREQQEWTNAQMEERGKELASKALKIWQDLEVSTEELQAARLVDRKRLASTRDVKKVVMKPDVRIIFEILSAKVCSLDDRVVEYAENKSVSYHAPGFFLEILPRVRHLVLLLPLDPNMVNDPSGVAQETSSKKFFFHAQYEGGIFIEVENEDDIERALPLVRQALLKV